MYLRLRSPRHHTDYPDASSVDGNPFRYCGEYFDDELGCVYLRARYYDPGTGRFTTQDGWEYMDSSDPLSLNLYTYCHNNPVMYWDPSGHLDWPGEIHQAVQLEILSNNPALTGEVWLTYPVTIWLPGMSITFDLSGRVDLVNAATGEIWEIKPMNWSPALTAAQLDNYANGTFASSKIGSTITPTIYNGTGEEYILSGTFTYKEYVVTYTYQGNGVIGYSYYDTKALEKVLTVAAGAGAAALGSAISNAIANGIGCGGRSLRDPLSPFYTIE